VNFTLPEDFLIKLFATRWMIVAGLAICWTATFRAFAGTIDKDAKVRFSWFWWLLPLVISAMHAYTFWKEHFRGAHWSVYVGAGMFVGFGVTAILFTFARLGRIRFAPLYALFSSASFPGAVYLFEARLIQALRFW